MNIFPLLTSTNIRILKLIDKEQLHIRDIADNLGISPGTVHKLAAFLKKTGLASETKQKNRILLSLNKHHPILKEIKRIINFNDILNAPAYRKLRKFGKIGIYGSFASGTNDKDSDLDIWIQTSRKELELRPLIRELEKQLNTRVNPVFLTSQKIIYLKKDDPEFYTRLLLTSIGDLFDQ